MNIYPNNYDNYIDATNEFIGGGGTGGGGTGGGGSNSSDIIINNNTSNNNLSDYIYTSNDYNNNVHLYLNNSNTYGEIRFTNLITTANTDRNHNVKIDYFGKLYLYHSYNVLTPTVLEGWKDIMNEIAGLIFGLQANGLEIIVVQGQIAGINFSISEILGTLTTLQAYNTATVANLEALQYGFFNIDDYNEFVMNNFTALSSTYAQRIETFSLVSSLSRVGQFTEGLLVPAGIGAVIGGLYTYLDYTNLHNIYSNVLSSNTNLTPEERKQIQNPTSNLIRNTYISFNSNFCNMSLEQGFINSNIKNSQLIPSLKSNKVLLGNITTPNVSYQMEGTGDINFNEYYRNSVSLTSLLSQKQDNMTATQPIFITTANIGLNYDSSLTKIGNNLSVVKTASAPLEWSGNNLILNYDSTLLNNSGSLGVSIAAESKWGYSGANIYNKSLTNVGIGTNSGLTSKLNVIGETYISSNTNIAISRLNFISSFTGSSALTLVTGTNEYYLQYTGNGTLVLNEPCSCDLLIVGAGGNGGAGAWGGGAGAGEVIYYPNFPLRNGTLNVTIGTSSTTATNRISKIALNGGADIITAKGGGNGASITNQSLFALFQNKKPWGMYFAEDWSGTTLSDSSGNGRHATTSGTITKTTASGNGATGPITYLTGTTSSTITWPSGSIPSTFTILSLTRYNNASANQQRILQANTLNFAHGHINTIGLGNTNSTRGVCFYGDTYKTSSAQTSSTTKLNWLCTIGKNSGSTPGNILLDGVASGTATGGIGNDILTINTGNNPSQLSDFAFGCVIIWNTALTDAEMVLLNNMINQYKNDGVYIPNVINAFTSATSGGSGGGGIIGVSRPGAAAGIKFDDYKSFVQAGLNGTSTTGGNGGSGSSLYNTRYTTNITGSSLSVGLGGSGASSSSTPITKSNYGDGGDGNGGVGFAGVIIIRFKLDSPYLQLKASKDNANSGLIINANEGSTAYQLRLYPWSDTFQLTGIATRGWSLRVHDGNNHLDLLNLFSSFGGRVGIKTKNPTATLDVNGDIACKTFNVVGNELYGITCQVVNQHETGEASINISAGASGNYGAMSVVYIPSENLGFISCSKSLQIKTQSIGGYIHIDNTTGNVGIGNNAPTYKLVVTGTIAANDIMVSGSINATTLGIGQVYATGIDNGYFNNVQGSIVNNKYLYSSNIYVNNFIDCQNKPIYNCSILYGTADIAKEWKPVTNYWHKDDQDRERFYFRNDPSAGVTDHYTMIKSGSYTIYFRDKDNTDYLSADRFGLDTYFPVTTLTTDYLSVVEPNASGTWQYRRMLIKFGSFTEFHRVFVDDELYIDYDDFMSKYVGRVVVSIGKTKHCKKEPGEKPWEILEDKDAITIDDSQPIVQLSRQKKDKRVYGVVTYRQVSDYGGRICVNGLGEGGIWIVNTNGNLENGDYLQTSNEIGYSEKQDDDILHNYTIAKIIMDCDFQLDSPKYKCEVIDEARDLRRAFVGCVYYCG